MRERQSKYLISNFFKCKSYRGPISTWPPIFLTALPIKKTQEKERKKLRTRHRLDWLPLPHHKVSNRRQKGHHSPQKLSPFLAVLAEEIEKCAEPIVDL